MTAGAARGASEFYDTRYHSRVYSKVMGNGDYFLGRAEVGRSLYFKGLEDKRVLDYGCGLGQNTALLPRAAGFDASRRAREICRKRGMKVYGKAADIPKGRWDIVFCSHVLEHLEDPYSTLRSLKPLLAPGGTLLLVLPRESHGPSPFPPDDNQHLFCWNFRTINNLLFRAGYRVLSNRTLYYNGFGLFQPLRRLLGPAAYVGAVKLLGRLRGTGELFVAAKPAGKGGRP